MKLLDRTPDPFTLLDYKTVDVKSTQSLVVKLLEDEILAARDLLLGFEQRKSKEYVHQLFYDFIVLMGDSFLIYRKSENSFWGAVDKDCKTAEDFKNFIDRIGMSEAIAREIYKRYGMNGFVQTFDQMYCSLNFFKYVLNAEEELIKKFLDKHKDVITSINDLYIILFWLKVEHAICLDNKFGHDRKRGLALYEIQAATKIYMTYKILSELKTAYDCLQEGNMQPYFMIEETVLKAITGTGKYYIEKGRAEILEYYKKEKIEAGKKRYSKERECAEEIYLKLDLKLFKQKQDVAQKINEGMLTKGYKLSPTRAIPTIMGWMREFNKERKNT